MSTLRRRLASISALFVAAAALLLLVPIWLPIAVVVDVVRGRPRLPSVRLLLFALGWAWLESTSVVIAFALWLAGQRNNHEIHYRLQAWWAASVLGVLRATTGISVSVENVGELRPGPVVMLCRHASLADSLVSAWVITSLAGLRPRYVLKRELLADPCLDIVGNRLPNYFLDRQAADSQVELDALTLLSTGMSTTDVAVIFPEGTGAGAAEVAGPGPRSGRAIALTAAPAPAPSRRLCGADRGSARRRHRHRVARGLRRPRYLPRNPAPSRP